MATVSFAAPWHRRTSFGVPCPHTVKFDRQNLDGTTTVGNADDVPVDGACSQLADFPGPNWSSFMRRRSDTNRGC
jgi:hypothetical protein